MLFDSFLCNYIALSFFGKIYAYFFFNIYVLLTKKGLGAQNIFKTCLWDYALRNYLGVINKGSGHILEKSTTGPKRKKGILFHFQWIGPEGGSKLYGIRSWECSNARLKIEHHFWMFSFLGNFLYVTLISIWSFC